MCDLVLVERHDLSWPLFDCLLNPVVFLVPFHLKCSKCSPPKFMSDSQPVQSIPRFIWCGMLSESQTTKPPKPLPSKKINISHLGKRKILFKYALSGGYVNSLGVIIPIAEFISIGRKQPSIPSLFFRLKCSLTSKLLEMNRFQPLKIDDFFTRTRSRKWFIFPVCRG